MHLDWEVCRLEKEKEETLFWKFLLSFAFNYSNPLTALSNISLQILSIGKSKNNEFFGYRRNVFYF